MRCNWLRLKNRWTPKKKIIALSLRKLDKSSKFENGLVLEAVWQRGEPMFTRLTQKLAVMLFGVVARMKKPPSAKMGVQVRG